MPTLNINGNIIVQTAAQWAADATVYSATKILITSDATYTPYDIRKFKIADGVQAWSGLDYLPIDVILTLGTSLQNQINNLVIQIPYYFEAAQFSPADGLTYIYGQLSNVAPSTSSATRFRVEVRQDGIIDEVIMKGNWLAGSNEPVTVAIRNVNTNTTVNLTTTLDMSLTSNMSMIFTGVNLTVSDGDELEIRIVSPTWSTNPTIINLSFTAWLIPN